MSRSAWWERIVTDYVFCFAFCVSCRIAIWGKVSLSQHGLEMISARAPVILCIVLLLLKPGPPSREGPEDPHPPEMGVTEPQAHIWVQGSGPSFPATPSLLSCSPPSATLIFQAPPALMPLPGPAPNTATSSENTAGGADLSLNSPFDLSYSHPASSLLVGLIILK